MSKQTIETMVDWIEENITEDATLEKMSSYVGYSSYYCSAKFHEITGISFKLYLNKRKLSLAALDLLESSDRIIDIAFRYGFSSHEAFTRSFFREFELSPSKFRREVSEVRLFNRIL